MSYSASGRWSPRVARGLEVVVYAVLTAAIALAVAGACGVLVAGCANTQRALEHAKDNVALSEGHATDPRNELTPDAERIGLVNRVSWQIQVFLLGGPRPDPDVIDLIPEETRRELGLLENSETKANKEED